MLTIQGISNAITKLGQPACIHSSLRSFGMVEGGAEAVIEGFLMRYCTILVPTFSSVFSVFPPLDQRPLRNGCGYYSWFNQRRERDTKQVYSPQSNEVDSEMGAIPRALLSMAERTRGNHPLNSFSSVHWQKN